MCGLFGAIKLNNNNTISTKVVYRNGKEMQNRGTHAVGWCQSIMHDTIEIEKYKGSTYHNRDLLKGALRNCTSIIGHTRHATHGSVEDNINNHPHDYANENLVGAVTHNGVIFDHVRIAKANKLTMQGECDSEIIARLLESYDAEIPMPIRIADAVNECDDGDSIALAVMEQQKGNTDLCLVARGNPIEYSIHNGILYYASTSKQLPKGSQSLNEGSILHIREGVGILETIDGLMNKYWSIGIGWSNYKKPVKKRSDTCQFVRDDYAYYDSFDSYYNANNTERNRFNY